MLITQKSELLILNLELDKSSNSLVTSTKTLNFLTVHHVDVINYKIVRISRRQGTASTLEALNILEPPSLASMMKMVAYYEFQKPPYCCVLNTWLVYQGTSHLQIPT